MQTYTGWHSAHEDGTPDQYLSTVLKPAFAKLFTGITGQTPTAKTKCPSELKAEFESLKVAAQTRTAQDLDRSAQLITAKEQERVRRAVSLLSTALTNIPTLGAALGVESQVALRQANRTLYGESQGWFVGQVRDNKKVQRINLGKIVELMRGFTFGGLHGSSTTHQISMFGRIKYVPPTDRIYSTGQLGEGFYLTDGDRVEAHRVYADSVAREAAKKGGAPYLYRIFLNREGMRSHAVPKDEWANMERNTVPPALTSATTGYDALTAPVVRSETVEQIKVNPHALDRVLALPARVNGSMPSEEVQKWLDGLYQERDEFRY